MNLAWQIDLTLASILNDNILIQIIDNPLIHRKVFDDIIHVNAAHPDQIPMNGIYIVD